MANFTENVPTILKKNMTMYRKTHERPTVLGKEQNGTDNK